MGNLLNNVDKRLRENATSSAVLINGLLCVVSLFPLYSRRPLFSVRLIGKFIAN